MAAINDITGDLLTSKTTTEQYRDGWDRIFGKKKEEEQNESRDSVSTNRDSDHSKNE